MRVGVLVVASRRAGRGLAADVLSSQVEDGLARREVREVDRRDRHLLWPLVDPTRAPEGERAATEATDAEVGVEGEYGRVGVLGERHVMAALILDNEAVVLIRVPGSN